MDLNICLFCEKRLFDDNLSFCSSACQAQEATKHCTLIHEADPYLSSRKHPLPLMQKSRMSKRAASFPSSSSPLTPASSFEMPHHRRRSFMFSTKDHPNATSPTRNSSLIGDGHASDIAFLSAYMQFHHRAPPVDNASLVSNTSSSGSSDMDSVYTMF
ncbi:predicted protein [Lichtheimia corymbifera JMRC:FSU:9682]|uniref:Uncharacterized protein n=1 Tax=Lichtheimia corymbifera JMRC:FSU:9682 TaxID=1263082 RepID=A0A068RGD7_9FUNG|nr:predicted protein [Lichtheimia corymbifera JMRC:FSU:9682]